MTTTGIRRFEERVIGGYVADATDIAIFRIIYASYLLFQIVPIASWLPQTPQAFFHPPIGFAAFFTAPPSAFVIVGLNLLLSLFASMLLVGWRTRVASLGTGLTLLILNSWSYSLGKIDHEVLLVIAPLVMRYSCWGSSLSVDSIRPPHAACEESNASPLALLAILIGFAMFTSGWSKATSGWLDSNRLCTYGYVVGRELQSGRETSVVQWALAIDSVWFWKMADWTTVVFELAFLPAALFGRSFRFMLIVASCFHLCVLLLLDIPFSANLIVYGAFVPYTTIPFFRSAASTCTLSTARAMTLWGAVISVGVVSTFSERALATAIHFPLPAVVIWIGAVTGAFFAYRVLCGFLSGVHPSPANEEFRR